MHQLDQATLASSSIAPGIVTIDEVLNVDECESQILRAQTRGFEPAPITTAFGDRVQSDTRNNDRCMFDDAALAALLWQRVSGVVAPKMHGRAAVGLNERFRLYRYAAGQQFDWHADAPLRRADGVLSLLSFIVYLNADYTGGATRFETAKVQGATGQALVFSHGLLHQGAPVTGGVKYVLRSDVMYGPLR